MKITHLRTSPLRGFTPATGWQRGTDPDDNLYTLVYVETDEGLVGTGSCFTTSSLVLGALEIIEPFLLGENPLEPDRISERLHQTTFWFGRGGAVTTTISGIDIALWDIAGQALGQPVASLLGGYYRDRVRAYASTLFDEPGVMVDNLLRLKEGGFRAIKLGWGRFGRVDAAYDELLVETARNAVGGDIELLVDAGGSEEWWPHGYKWALRCARMLAGYDVGWFEEALSPDDVEGFALLRQQAEVPIATGEALTRRQSFSQLLARRAVDIIQPDVTKVGGISEVRKLMWAAYDCGVELVGHGWNTAIGLAADLHLAAARPIARFVEYQTGSPYIDGIAAEPFVLDEDGCLPVPRRPGLGVELDTERVAAMTGGSSSRP
jgi:D-galactarolactone cycloisomerase